MIFNYFSIIESLPVNEVEDLLERCHNTLDDLWRCEPSFPKDRIKNLMDIIGKVNYPKKWILEKKTCFNRV